MANINELAKQTLITLKERHLKPTPQNYSDVFEELSQKFGLSSHIKAKIDKYKDLLLPVFQEEFKTRKINTLDEFLSFLVSMLNRRGLGNTGNFYSLMRNSLEILLISKDKKIKELASLSLDRLSRTMDQEAIFLLEKKWFDFKKSYEDKELDEALKQFGIKNTDYTQSIKKLLEELEYRSYKRFANLIAYTLKGSLEGRNNQLDDFANKLLEKPWRLGLKEFEDELLFMVNKRISLDNSYVEKNLNFFDSNLEKLGDLLDSLKNFNQENLKLIKADEKDHKIGFDDIKARILLLDEKINAINEQFKITTSTKERENWSISKEIDKLDELFLAYKNNYALCAFRVVNYRFIMEKYGVSNLNEIFVRFKKTLKENCAEFDELWLLDEKTYLVILRGKTYEKTLEWVQKNASAIENFKFIYKQDVVLPKLKVVFMDKQSYPHINLFEELNKRLDDEE